jgi:anti-sigma28 factor (negative regulator of flagellin synthesis)
MSSINSSAPLTEATRLRISPASRPTEPASVLSPAGTRSTTDAVEISPLARALSTLRGLPEVREDLVRQVRDELANGTYDLDGKLGASAEQIAAEIRAEFGAGL